MVILLLYMLFAGGWVWAVTNEAPTSTVLDSQQMLHSPDVVFRQEYYAEFTVSTDIAGARWLVWFTPQHYPLCSDEVSGYHVLNSYGGRPRTGNDSVGELPNLCASQSIIYLSEYDTLYGKGLAWWGPGVQLFEFSLASVNFMNMSRIYSDGSTVYMNTP